MIRSILILLVLAALAAPVMAQESILAAARLPKGISLCGEAVPMGIEDVRERFEKEMLLILWDKPQVLLWLKRSTRYFPFITEELKKAGMPDDLKYLAIVESALRPHADSSRGAVGYWQLMPETARKYGLTVNEFVDQRRDIYTSTPAALKYLLALHAKFSSWTMALAAYNMGEEGLDAEMLEQKTKDYYTLYLPLETQRFIFRILAVKLIFADPKSHGFELESEDFYEPMRFDTVPLDCFQETPIRLVAEAANTYFKRIKDLNPQLRGHYVQAGHHTLRLPLGSAKGFKERFQILTAAYDNSREQRIYVVQEGDSLSSIADQFDVPLAALLIWNRLDMQKKLYPGDRLVIHPRPASPTMP